MLSKSIGNKNPFVQNNYPKQYTATSGNKTTIVCFTFLIIAANLKTNLFYKQTLNSIGLYKTKF